mmetsp:Transcript_16138/g.56294  ORF Transcript_16138/g.56294 Transcript_16138/m.56294 type:complete len:303 (+) Transcript_16138:699-1607(+)
MQTEGLGSQELRLRTAAEGVQQPLRRRVVVQVRHGHRLARLRRQPPRQRDEAQGIQARALECRIHVNRAGHLRDDLQQPLPEVAPLLLLHGHDVPAQREPLVDAGDGLPARQLHPDGLRANHLGDRDHSRRGGDDDLRPLQVALTQSHQCAQVRHADDAPLRRRRAQGRPQGLRHEAAGGAAHRRGPRGQHRRVVHADQHLAHMDALREVFQGIAHFRDLEGLRWQPRQVRQVPPDLLQQLPAAVRLPQHQHVEVRRRVRQAGQEGREAKPSVLILVSFPELDEAAEGPQQPQRCRDGLAAE